MDSKAEKIHRSTKLIKAFMALVIIMQIIQYFQTSALDFGALAGATGVLALLRGILLSPGLLAKPVKEWSSLQSTFSKNSYSYFILAFVLIVVSAF